LHRPRDRREEPLVVDRRRASRPRPAQSRPGRAEARRAARGGGPGARCHLDQVRWRFTTRRQRADLRATECRAVSTGAGSSRRERRHLEAGSRSRSGEPRGAPGSAPSRQQVDKRPRRFAAHVIAPSSCSTASGTVKAGCSPWVCKTRDRSGDRSRRSAPGHFIVSDSGTGAERANSGGCPTGPGVCLSDGGRSDGFAGCRRSNGCAGLRLSDGGAGLRLSDGGLSCGCCSRNAECRPGWCSPPRQPLGQANPAATWPAVTHGSSDTAPARDPAPVGARRPRLAPQHSRWSATGDEPFTSRCRRLQTTRWASGRAPSRRRSGLCASLRTFPAQRRRTSRW
jgi:hypothetical protein